MFPFDSYLAHLDADSHLLAAAAAKGLEPDVPCCPGWTVRDVVLHVAELHAHKAELVAGSWVEESPPRPTLPEGADLLDWYRAQAARLYKTLEAADPSAPANTFGRDRTVGFWFRRMAHETLVHRVDAEQAHGYESALDLELAVDGVAELFDVFVSGHPVWARFQPGQDVIRVDVGDRSWTVRLGKFVGSKKGRDYVVRTMMEEPGAEPGAVVTGDPDRVFLWMWGRAPIDGLTLTGAPDIADNFRTTCARRQVQGSPR
jgi:uncharacterized protein (TIGR03083 family)